MTPHTSVAREIAERENTAAVSELLALADWLEAGDQTPLPPAAIAKRIRHEWLRPRDEVEK